MNEPARSLTPLHGGQLQQIATRYGISAKSLLDFSANINPAGPPTSVLLAIQRALANPETLTTYPDLEMTELKQVIAKRSELRSENIVIANGFVPLLDAALHSLDIKRCLLPVPAFNEYRKTLEGARVAVEPHPLASKDNFSYELNSILKALSDRACDAILLANPQNPSGALCRSEQMLRLIEMTAERGITVLLDEAFIDYFPVHSLMRHVIEQSHLIVFRSVTKFFAIPGLRVAYAACHATKAQMLNRSLAPWPVTGFASDAVCAALGDEDYAKESHLENKRRRSWLEQQLHKLEIETYPSEANFLLLRFPAKVDVGLLWERMILEQQIVLRSCANFEGLDAGHLRVAVRSEQENGRLIDSLHHLMPGKTTPR
jgi:threonine-phosphate decarboxylase